MSDHNRYDTKYITHCVESLEKYGADNVVGYEDLATGE
jgi:hypothetical protein